METKTTVIDSGELTPEELKRLLENAEELPLWKMHPLAQHCLRVYQELRPGNTERRDIDSCGWVKNHMRSSQMFMEKYRLIPENFNMAFIDGCAEFHNWNKHRNA